MHIKNKALYLRHNNGSFIHLIIKIMDLKTIRDAAQKRIKSGQAYAVKRLLAMFPKQGQPANVPYGTWIGCTRISELQEKDYITFYQMLILYLP